MKVRASVDIELDSSSAFDTFVEELAVALARLGVSFDPSPTGRITEGKAEVGRVLSWRPGEGILLEWHPADWDPDVITRVELRFKPTKNGTQVTLEHDGLDSLVGDRSNELAGWFATEVAAPFLTASGPKRLGDWITDRRARRPSGKQARDGYRDPVHHRPNFRLILHLLKLTPDDYLLEVGCGGGAFLHDALRSGCSAAAVDHSPDMVRVALELNHDAVVKRRLEIVGGEADRLPYPDGKFTCVVSTNVFGFITDPLGMLREARRVLAKGGRLIIFTLSKEMRGTMAAPEPMGSRLCFYEDEELSRLAREAGFVDVQVERPDLEPFAKESEIPEDYVPSFSGHDGQLLLARKG